MGPHVPSVTSLCLQYIKHDPNYNYDSDEEEEQMETEDSEFSEQGEWPTCPWAGGWKWVQPSRESPSQRRATSGAPILIPALPQAPALPLEIWILCGTHTL